MSKDKSKNTKKEQVKNCEVIYSSSVTSDEVKQCVDIFLNNSSVECNTQPKGFKGRGQPVKISLRKNLNIIFRRNKRGGILGKFIQTKYLIPLNFPENSRPFKEFLCLKHLREVGIPVPEPLLAIVKRKNFIFYEGGLFTKELSQTSTLLDLIEDMDQAKLREHAYNAGLWASRALDLGYLHPDLHLGNVLVRSSGVSLIDFDKYRNVGDKKAGIKFLKERWDRGVSKRVTGMETQKVLKESFLAGLQYGQRS